ncbi:MAG: arylsulfatase [Bacteroidales bacterium]|nr:arylsulfatase [Bacteroidales bacterium]MBR0029531.1 arylsulfatase [Bacteroidales bacterium]MBR0083951.1 arylsulfatase [Bacteroidales bacterium]
MTNKTRLLTGLAAASGALMASIPSQAQYSPTPPFKGKIGKTVQDTKTDYPAHNPVARLGAPNVVWIILDDTGFGVSSAFGGLVETPVLDYLAENGLRFNNFHNASISAATRACLLTGRNHHSSHMGRFNDDKYGAPGYDTYLPMEHGTIAEILRENGYATFCVGKYNVTPSVDGSNAGPFNRWPTGRGFDHYYGFNPTSGSGDQWHPLMYRDTHREPEDPQGRPAIVRLADEAINYIAEQKTAAPDQPFFLYFAPGTAHTPFHVSKEWIDKYHGRFDSGWEEYSRKTLENQLRMGVVPQGTELAITNADVQSWDSLPAKERKLYARQMEAFAGFMTQTDYEIGRIVEFLRESGQLDNTLFLVALGDNGASGEGCRTGGRELSPEMEQAYIDAELAQYDHYGDERTWPFYPTGWAQACNTPFRYYKKWSDYEGGTHDGLIVFWPAGNLEKGAIRTQYTHVVDVLPTTVELTGSTVPETIGGYKQTPVEGVSFAYAVADGSAPDRKRIQYYEMNSSYGLYKDGWKVQFPNGAVNGQRYPFPDTDVHLYNLKEDFNEAHDLAAQYPGKVKELLREFDRQARKYNVYPLKNGKANVDPDYPEPTRRHYDIFLGARDWAEFPFFDGSAGKPYTISVYIKQGGPESCGVLFSQKGYSLYVLDGKLVYAAADGSRLVSDCKLPEGACVVKAVARHKDKKTRISLFIDDAPAGSVQLSYKQNVSGKANAINVGRAWGVPVNSDYSSPFLFTGKISKATIDVER